MKLTFWALFSAGVVACSSLGIGKTLERSGGNWMALPMLAGIFLGVAILALAISFGTGVRLPALSTDRAMVLALGSLIAAKVLVGLGSALVARG